MAKEQVEVHLQNPKQRPHQAHQCWLAILRQNVFFGQRDAAISRRMELCLHAKVAHSQSPVGLLTGHTKRLQRLLCSSIWRSFSRPLGSAFLCRQFCFLLERLQVGEHEGKAFFQSLTLGV